MTSAGVRPWLAVRESAVACLTVVLAAAGLMTAACAGGEGRGGATTTIDTLADTVMARTAGVPVTLDLVEELRIAPGIDDTTLFTEVWEYAVDTRGRIWVLDQPTSRILLFDDAGRLVRILAGKGSGPGEIQSSSGLVALGDSGLAVWDTQNGRISVWDAEGNYRTSYPTPGGFGTSNGLVTDRTGALYLRWPVAKPEPGEVIGRLGLIPIVPTGRTDSLHPPVPEVNTPTYTATRTSGSGRSASSTAAWYGPMAHWSWHPDGYFVVGDGGEYVITLARRGALPLVIRREAPPVPVDPAENAEQRAFIEFMLKRTDPDWSWSGPDLPAVKAPLTDLRVSPDGQIWARIPLPSERIPEAERQPVREGRPPPASWQGLSGWEVFDPEGRVMGRVEIPARARLIEVRGDRVWVLDRDADGLPAVVRFRIASGLDRS